MYAIRHIWKIFYFDVGVLPRAQKNLRASITVLTFS